MERNRCIHFFVRSCLMLCFAALVLIAVPATVKADTSGFWTYQVNSDNTIAITGYTGAEQKVSVPSKIANKTVVQLGRYTDWSYESNVFESNSYIEEVKIPSSVTLIGRSAFSNCANLKKVTGGSGVKEIGNYAFYGSAKLTSVAFSKKLEKIDYESFRNCQSLKSITLYKGLKSIGESAFRDCDALTSVTLPAGVSNVSSYVFRSCDKLSSVTIGANTVVASYMFADCPSLSKAVIKNGYTNIGNSAFSNCVGLKSVTIPSSIRNIDTYAFSNCTALPSVSIPAGTRWIGYQVFYGCSSLSKVTLKKGLISIGEGAFQGTALKDVVIPNTVVRIDDYAFHNCGNLKAITIPNSVTRFDRYYADRSFDWYNDFSGATIRCYANSTVHNHITASSENIDCQLLNPVKSTKLKFSTGTIYMFTGQSKKLSYTVSPQDTTDAIVWESSAASIAAVNEVGELETKGVGSATIIATTTSGKRATVNIVVSNAPTSIYFVTQNKTVTKGKTYTQKATVKDSTGVRTDIKPTYKSSNTSVATVSSSGKVTAKKAGTVKITATTAGLSASYKIKVVNPLSTPKVSKSQKTLTVKTIKGAKVSVKADKSVLGKASKTVTANSKGAAKIKFKKSIKNVTVTITVSKSGYEKKTVKKKY